MNFKMEAPSPPSVFPTVWSLSVAASSLTRPDCWCLVFLTVQSILFRLFKLCLVNFLTSVFQFRARSLRRRKKKSKKEKILVQDLKIMVLGTGRHMCLYKIMGWKARISCMKLFKKNQSYVSLCHVLGLN